MMLALSIRIVQPTQYTNFANGLKEIKSIDTIESIFNEIVHYNKKKSVYEKLEPHLKIKSN